MFENVDGRRTDDGVTGILIAHLRAFGSGELKMKELEWSQHKCFCYLCILHLLRISFYFIEFQGVLGCNSMADLSFKIVLRTH